MPDPVLRVERAGALAWVILQRPPANLLDAELAEQLHQTLADLDGENGVGAVALTGAGDVFCGGADSQKLRETQTAERFAAAAVELFAHFPRARKPILAAVNGDALAGGFGLLCSADIVVAAEGARVGTVEAAYGTWPMIAQVAAARRVPVKAAITNALTGIPFSAARAYELGILDEVVPAGRVRDRTATLAEAAMSGAPAAHRGRPQFYRNAELSYDDALREGAAAFVSMFGQ